MADEAGFTLIEVIVIVAVLGLMVGLVVQRGPPRSATLDLRTSAEQVARTLRVARSSAIATNRTVLFRLDVAHHAFAVDNAAPRLLPPAFALSIDAVAPGADGGTPTIGFAADGSSSGGRIWLGEGDHRIEVGVDWLTGRVNLGQTSVADAR